MRLAGSELISNIDPAGEPDTQREGPTETRGGMRVGAVFVYNVGVCSGWAFSHALHSVNTWH